MDSNAIALLLGVLVGLVLALTGAGGGVLSIPLLVFGLHLPVQQAAPVGLVAVCVAATLGAVLGLREHIVRYRAAALIGTVGMLTAPMGVALAQQLPNRPLLAAFALVLVYSSWHQLKADAAEHVVNAVPCRVSPDDQRLTWTLPCARALAGTGVVSGLLSGLLGVGGGFVIVPALSKYTDLRIRSVQVTSLAVMAMVSFSAASAAAWRGSLNWAIAIPFAGGSLLALLLGRLVAQRLHPTQLQRGFAWFNLGVALLMLARAAGWLAG